ncbi:UTRA domain-containing protein [Streptomyces sp. DSM 44915]|uniref:UTRA domain-containing protein n=1 Tax=Streptomyces chisholmiae TaxID=3075540 RepID=A0ABU2JNC3_9ACTN|nr:UTRA domain-containing protein [Streptomyces sp. DSM 44915]MDT0266492.1 UTRA domain-containing protein [Streptomyces sp. DSM 44915]
MVGGNEWVNTSAPYTRARAAGQGDAWGAETAARGRRGTQRVLGAGTVPAPEPVARAFGLPAGHSVVERRRIIYLDDEATEVTGSYYPLEVAAGTRLAQRAKIPGGAVTLLASLGFVARTVTEEVRARMPDEEEKRLLDLDHHEPVLHLLRHTFGDHELPFQVDVSVFHAGTQSLRYEMRTV